MSGDLPSPSVGPDAYHQLPELIGRGRVVRVLLHGAVPAWLLTHPDDVAAAAIDPRLTSDDTVLSGGNRSSVKFGFMGMDGPDHARLRRITASVFSANRIAAMRPSIVRLVRELLDLVAPTGRAELIADLARPVPMRVICELLGIPHEERDHFEATATAMLQPAVGDPARVATTRAEMFDYLAGVLRSKRQRPTTDLLSVLATSTQVSDKEAAECGALILVAGYETTADLIGTSLLALIDNPGQMRLLRGQPALSAGAVDELARYCGPISLGVTRYTREPVTIADVDIAAGERVILGFGAANRDPDRFAHPCQLDVTRIRGPHFAFGYGPHYCLGAPLARLETEIAVREVVDRLDNLVLDGTPVWRHSIFHGVDRLPVRFRPAYPRHARS